MNRKIILAASSTLAGLLLAVSGINLAAAQQQGGQGMGHQNMQNMPHGQGMQNMQQMRGQMMQQMQTCVGQMQQGNMPMGQNGQMMNRDQMRTVMMQQMQSCMTQLDQEQSEDKTDK